MKITIAQIEVVPGEPQINKQKMVKAIEQAKDEESDLIVFSELCIPGYLLGDNWERNSFITECMEVGEDIDNLAQGIVIVYGNVFRSLNKKGEDGRPRLENCVFIAKDGKHYSRQTKFLQPNYREFDDDRHFYSARKDMSDKMFQEMSKKDWIAKKPQIPFHDPLIVDGLKFQCIICEDGWDNDYEIKPLEHLNADCIINLSCSPFTIGKSNKRNRVFSGKSKKLNTPIIYVNNVGIQNNTKTMYSFDGDSCIYFPNGVRWYFQEPFEDGLCSLKLLEKGTDKYKKHVHNPETLQYMDVKFGLIAPDYACFYGQNDESDEAHLHMAITYACKKYCEQFGIKKVVIGASGGVDNSLVAAIFSTFIEKENLYLVNMPSKFNSEKTKCAAKQLAENIGCKYLEIPIQNEVDSIRNSLENALGEECSQLAFENIQARYRSNSILAGIAQMVGGVFTCNGNKSEATVGYCTIGGDLMGFLAPIMDLWKHQVYDLCKWHNENIRDIIPQETLDMIPSAELSADQNIDEGQGDPLVYEYHDYLFMSWVENWNRHTYDDLIFFYQEGTINNELKCKTDVYELFPSFDEFENDLRRWWNLYDGLAIVKRELAPMIVGVSRRSFGFDHRETITPPFYRE